MFARSAPFLLGCVLLGGCVSPTPPRSGMFRLASSVPEGWTAGAPGRLRTEAFGAEVVLDLSGASAPVELVARNVTAESLVVRVGVRGIVVSGPVGQVLQRPLDPAAAAGGDYVPCEAGRAVPVAPRMRAVFLLDDLLGREPSYGEYLVFELEVVDRSGRTIRRSVPLIAGPAKAAPGPR